MSESAFEKEREKVRQEIWSLFHVECNTVIDVGLGERAGSTKNLLDKGATVIAVDAHIEPLKTHKDLNALFVCCTIEDPPFKPNTADIVLFWYTLHEIDPALHCPLLSKMARIASKVVIVEPSPGTSPGYARYENLLQESMNAIGEFEEYKQITYWETLVEDAGFSLVTSETITHTEEVPYSVKEKMSSEIVEWLKEKRVPEQYIEKALGLKEYIGEKMNLPGITIVVGETSL